MATCKGQVSGTMTRRNVTGSLVTLAIIGAFCQSGFNLVQYVYYDDGTTYYRKGVRAGYFVVDIRLTASPGWTGAENTDWKCLFSLKSDS